MTIGFAKGVEAARKKYEARMNLLHRKVSMDMFRRIVLKTPVDTGRARGNWMLGINTIPIQSAWLSGTKAQQKRDSLASIVTGLEALKFGDSSTVLANSVPYISVLEYGGFPNPPKFGSWHKGAKGVRRGGKKKGRLGYYQVKSVGGFSFQAPNGMVRATVEEYRPTLNRAIALVKREIP